MNGRNAFFGVSMLLVSSVSTFIYSAPLSDTEKPLVLILLGPPRSGEGMLALKSSQTFSIPYISAASLLYDQINQGTEIGEKAREHINQKGSIPESLILTMLYDRIKQEKNERAFLLDHMPRTEEQAVELQKALGDQYRFLVISISVPDETLLLKAEVRLICEKCGRVYHKQFSPPEKADACDLCGSSLTQRDDDSSENVKKRLDEYRKSVAPILAFYAKEGSLCEVNGNCSLDATFDEIKRLFQRYNTCVR